MAYFLTSSLFDRSFFSQRSFASRLWLEQGQFSIGVYFVKREKVRKEENRARVAKGGPGVSLTVMASTLEEEALGAGQTIRWKPLALTLVEYPEGKLFIFWKMISRQRLF